MAFDGLLWPLVASEDLPRRENPQALPPRQAALDSPRARARSRTGPIPLLLIHSGAPAPPPSHSQASPWAKLLKATKEQQGATADEAKGAPSTNERAAQRKAAHLTMSAKDSGIKSLLQVGSLLIPSKSSESVRFLPSPSGIKSLRQLILNCFWLLLMARGSSRLDSSSSLGLPSSHPPSASPLLPSLILTLLPCPSSLHPPPSQRALEAEKEIAKVVREATRQPGGVLRALTRGVTGRGATRARADDAHDGAFDDDLDGASGTVRRQGLAAATRRRLQQDANHHGSRVKDDARQAVFFDAIFINGEDHKVRFLLRLLLSPPTISRDLP